MKDIQQLIKKNSQEGRYEDIFPKTFIDAVSKDFASVYLNSKPIKSNYWNKSLLRFKILFVSLRCRSFTCSYKKINRPCS